MPFIEKLGREMGGLAESLFGGQEYYKGGLMRSRIGANEALTQHRGAQTRDLDYQHGLKQNLIRALMGRKDPAMLQGVQYGDPKNFIEANILATDQGTKNKTLVEMLASQNPVDQTLARNIQLGMTGKSASEMNRINLLAPEEKRKLIAETGLRNQQRNTSGALMGQHQQKTQNLVSEQLMKEATGQLNLAKITATMGHDAAESAGRINKLKSEKAELDKNFQLADEKYRQLQAKGINHKNAMEHMAKIPIATAPDGTVVTYADMVAVGAGKEGAKAVIGGSQIGGTAGLQVSQNLLDGLLKDKDSLFNVPMGDGSGKTIEVIFEDANEAQKEIIFNRRLKMIVDAMAKQMGIHPNQRAEWKKQQMNLGKQTYKDSTKQDKVSKKLQNGDKNTAKKTDTRTREDIFNNLKIETQPMSSLDQRLNQLSGYENIGSQTMDQLLAEGNVGTTAINTGAGYAATPGTAMPTGGGSYLENLKRSHPEVFAKLSAAQLAQFGSTARR